uniref:Peptidase C1A papain C-terminal domain-containing protein n=1 Tax=Chromera velia CCMP2878 TaxID=1169474 RepID=A0A0K6S9C8_9ALVE|eukprot:Cvel_7846.t2-p1 / transcript=Cvel_7846.t2 / gene=Cvel_7846 / organism=Chromera_velia_CCMP2878 / gene_product=hypothetical protein / transcript_product=hypothetical protein / location=Cvel_scaffold420:4042-9295(+) / protein_length=495 / sequence_SO=supercontig / SO=protein_coding / is_pseudo=false
MLPSHSIRPNMPPYSQPFPLNPTQTETPTRRPLPPLPPKPKPKPKGNFKEKFPLQRYAQEAAESQNPPQVVHKRKIIKLTVDEIQAPLSETVAKRRDPEMTVDAVSLDFREELDGKANGMDVESTAKRKFDMPKEEVAKIQGNVEPAVLGWVKDILPLVSQDTMRMASPIQNNSTGSISDVVDGPIDISLPPRKPQPVPNSRSPPRPGKTPNKETDTVGEKELSSGGNNENKATVVRAEVRKAPDLCEDCPPSVDWRGVLPPAGLQGGICNSCYAWAAVASIAGRHAIALHDGSQQLDEVSQRAVVQEILDCARWEVLQGTASAVGGKDWKTKPFWFSKGRGHLRQLSGKVSTLASTRKPAEDPSMLGVYSTERAKGESDRPLEACSLERDASGLISLKQEEGILRPSQVMSSSASWRKPQAKHVIDIIKALQSGPIAVGIKKEASDKLSSVDLSGYPKGDCDMAKQPSEVIQVVKIERGKNICNIEKYAWWVTY